LFFVFSFSTEMSKKGIQFQKTANDTLVGLSVLTRYNNKMYRIDEILFDKNPMSTFDYQGNPITFVDYYKNHYDIEIKDKAQPLLLSRFIYIIYIRLFFIFKLPSFIIYIELRRSAMEERTRLD
jgi:hypothetical protein